METENQKLRERVEELSRETMLLAHTITDLTAKLKLATSAAPQPVDAAQAVPGEIMTDREIMLLWDRHHLASVETPFLSKIVQFARALMARPSARGAMPEGFKPLPSMSQFATFHDYAKAMDGYDAEMRKPHAAASVAQPTDTTKGA